MALDTLEFRSPIVEVARRDGTTDQLLVNAVWQRRLTSLWNYVKRIRVSATLDFPSTATLATSTLTVNVANAALGDFVQVSPAAAGLIITGSFYTGFVSAPGIATIMFCNMSAGAINPPSGVFQIQVTPQ